MIRARGTRHFVWWLPSKNAKISATANPTAQNVTCILTYSCRRPCLIFDRLAVQDCNDCVCLLHQSSSLRTENPDLWRFLGISCTWLSRYFEIYGEKTKEKPLGCRGTVIVNPRLPVLRVDKKLLWCAPWDAFKTIVQRWFPKGAVTKMEVDQPSVDWKRKLLWGDEVQQTSAVHIVKSVYIGRFRFRLAVTGYVDDALSSTGCVPVFLLCVGSLKKWFRFDFFFQ